MITVVVVMIICGTILGVSQHRRSIRMIELIIEEKRINLEFARTKAAERRQAQDDLADQPS